MFGRSLSAPSGYSCGVTTTDDAYCWGSTGGGALRNGSLTSSNVPVAVLGELAFQSVTTGGPLSCGVTTAGAAYCWGTNGSGEFGDGPDADSGSNVPVPVGGP